MTKLKRTPVFISVMFFALISFAHADETRLPETFKIAGYKAQSQGDEYPTVYSFLMTKPKENKELAFEDGSLSVEFFPRKEDISFTLLNKTNDPMRINWDQVSYIDLSNVSHRVTHSGVKLMDRDRPQVPTIVPPTAKIQDTVVPSDYIRYDSDKSGGWSQDPLFPEAPLAASYVGSSFSIFMPIDVSGAVKNYLFSFKIEGVRPANRLNDYVSTTKPLTAVGRATVEKKYYGTPQARPMTISAAESKAKSNLLKKLQALHMPDGTKVADAADSSKWRGVEQAVNSESVIADKQYLSDGSIEVTVALPASTMTRIILILTGQSSRY